MIDRSAQRSIETGAWLHYTAVQTGMPAQSHPAVLAAHEAADAVQHHVHAPTASFWRSWFEGTDERHFADEVRAFIATLAHLLDVPPQMLTRNDLAAVGEDVERAVKKMEASIDDSAGAGSDAAASLAPAIYVIRARYEELYTRGASKV